MSVPRRQILKAGAIAALAVGIPVPAFGHALTKLRETKQANPHAGFAIPAKSRLDIISYFTKETFNPYLNTPFRFRSKAAVPLTTLILVEVSDLKARPNQTTDGFSLIFTGPDGQSLQSETYKVEHDALGRFSLFITPVDKPDGQRRYEALFNCLA